jgi:pimeloyl-ACP methyl ester carboxylesterase
MECKSWTMQAISGPAPFVAMAAALSLLLASCAPFSPSPSPPAASPKAVRLAYSEEGHGEPLLLLHGLGASSYAWRYVMPELAKKYRVIALDLKGFGQSDKPRDDKYSLFDQARLVDRFISERKLRNLTLVGHSFGGGVALALALKDKERKSKKRRIKRLILIDSIAYKQDIPWGIALMRTPLISDLGISLIPPETQMKLALQFAYHDKSKIPPDAPREYARQLSTPNGKYALLRTAAQLIPENIDEFTARYSELDLKTLRIWCRNDGIVPLAYGRRLYNNLPNARLHILPACVHLPQEELPQLTSKLMLDFLAGK